ncbi:HlyD family secretion protein [Bryobacter aggregatus]|uniref:HlyD family secretion protein n=1 Tax=Bryobacter aggregatus TaxID=360054 RepID=UPI0004E0D28D|nr:HlyD family efflux transporter periplasmic adaptor subunit [Bryobacter aggregatus]
MTAFSKTYLALLQERSGGSVLAIATGLALLGGWMWWATQIPVSLYEVSSEARLELDASTYPVQAPFAGRVVKTSLRAGQLVKQGEVMVEIDAAPDQLQMRQEQVRAIGLAPEIARLRNQLQAEEAAREAEQRSAKSLGVEAQSRIREAEAAMQFAEDEWKRTQKLSVAGLVAARDLDRSAAELRRLRASVVTLEAAPGRLAQEQATKDRERDVRIERIRSEIVKLESERSTIGAAIEKLGYEIERKKVRAPIGGRLAESLLLRVGAVVQEGEKLGSILPSGALMIAGVYPAPAAFGRIRAGQKARMRLQGFPWAEFGAVQATVSRVAQEIRDQQVRVELYIDADQTLRMPLEHGMPGAVEIEVERIAPAALLLRSAGQALSAPQLGRP